MFGFFKKKNDADVFVNDLTPVIADMSVALPFLGEEDNNEMVRRSVSDFLEKNQKTSITNLQTIT